MSVAATRTVAPTIPGARESAVSWPVLTLAVAATSIVVGVIWDISWHKSIGRDTFWTPAHVAIYFGGVVAGVCGGWLVMASTFFGAAERLGAVRFWGMRGPLGAWVAIWGGFAMLTSAPFDDWWHNAYGLDVEILSPPHSLLALGMAAVAVGALLLALSEQNRRGIEGPRTGESGLAYAYVAAVLLSLVAIMATEYRHNNLQHSGTFYVVAAAIYPLFLLGPALAARVRWPATTIAALYMLINLAMIWILPLFPAEPKLAPIYNPLDRMAADAWPLVLVVPGLAIDLLMRRFRGRPWLLSPLLAVAFVGLLWLVQWHFSELLLSDHGRNWFFAADRQWSYGARPGPWQTEFWRQGSDPLTAGRLAIALGLALLSVRLGLAWGSWMSKVQR